MAAATFRSRRNLVSLGSRILATSGCAWERLESRPRGRVHDGALVLQDHIFGTAELNETWNTSQTIAVSHSGHFASLAMIAGVSHEPGPIALLAPRWASGLGELQDELILGLWRIGRIAIAWIVGIAQERPLVEEPESREFDLSAQE
jgi:hypothetical protein